MAIFKIEKRNHRTYDSRSKTIYYRTTASLYFLDGIKKEFLYTMKNIIEVLYFFDEPLIFTRLISNDLYMLVKVGEEQNNNQYIAKRTNKEIINSLKDGSLSVLGGLLYDGDILTYIVFDMENNIISIEEKHLNEIPSKILPKSGVPLYYYMNKTSDTVKIE